MHAEEKRIEQNRGGKGGGEKGERKKEKKRVTGKGYQLHWEECAQYVALELHLWTSLILSVSLSLSLSLVHCTLRTHKSLDLITSPNSTNGGWGNSRSHTFSSRRLVATLLLLCLFLLSPHLLVTSYSTFLPFSPIVKSKRVRGTHKLPSPLLHHHHHHHHHLTTTTSTEKTFADLLHYILSLFLFLSLSPNILSKWLG